MLPSAANVRLVFERRLATPVRDEAGKRAPRDFSWVLHRRAIVSSS